MSWEDESQPVRKAEEHELMIDSGCFGHVCPPLVRTAIPNSEFFKCRGSGSEQRGTATLWTDSVIRTRDDEEWQTSFDSDQI